MSSGEKSLAKVGIVEGGQRWEDGCQRERNGGVCCNSDVGRVKGRRLSTLALARVGLVCSAGFIRKGTDGLGRRAIRYA